MAVSGAVPDGGRADAAAHPGAEPCGGASAAAAGAGFSQHCRGRFFQPGSSGKKQRRSGAADGHLQPDEARHGAAADHPAGLAPGRGAEPCAGKGSGTHPAGGA